LPDSDLHDELLRARDRLHKLEGSAVALATRLRTLERRMDDLEPKVTRMEKADDIADAVAAKMNGVRGEMFTGLQKLGLGVFLVASPVVSAFILKALGG